MLISKVRKDWLGSRAYLVYLEEGPRLFSRLIEAEEFVEKLGIEGLNIHELGIEHYYCEFCGAPAHHPFKFPRVVCDLCCTVYTHGFWCNQDPRDIVKKSTGHDVVGFINLGGDLKE